MCWDKDLGASSFFGRGPREVLGGSGGNEPEPGEKISFTRRMDEPPNVTMSDEDFEIIHQVPPSLVKGCSGAFPSWYLQSVLFLPCVVRGCPQLRRGCRKPRWYMGPACKWPLCRGTGGRALRWHVDAYAWFLLARDHGSNYFWNDFLKKGQVLLGLRILF